MSSTLRRLMLLLLAAGVAGLWIWMGRNATTGRIAAAATANANAEPGYVARDAELIETGDDGAPLYRLRAERVEQARPAANIFLGQPRLNYQADASAPWTLQAERGVLLAGTEQAQLYGAVHAAGSDTRQRPLQVRTEQLLIDMHRQRVSSDAMVTIDWATLRLTARGLRINLMDGSLRLESQGHGQILH